MTGPSSGSSSPLGISPRSSTKMAKGSVNGKMPDTPAVKKPDLDEYRKQIDVLQEEINSLHKKLDANNLRITELTKGNTQYQQKRDELRSNIDAVQQRIDILETLRNRKITEIEGITRSGRDARIKIQGLKKALGFQSDGEIDEQIRLIERHMMASRLTVTEENKLISEIRRLEKSKPLVNKYAHMESETTQTAQTEVLQLRVDFDNVKEDLKNLQQKKRELNQAFSELVASRSKTTAPVREISDQKDEIKRQLCEKRARMNELRDEMFKKRREFDAYQAAVSRAQRETMLEQRKRRNLERQREEIETELEEIDGNDWIPDLQLITQTLLYVTRLVERSKLLTNEDNVKEDSEKKEDGNTIIEEDGMIAMKPKKDREEEYYYKPTKKKAEKKTKKHSSSLTQPIVHDIMTLGDFARLGVEPPLTLQECPSLLKTLEEKRDQLKKEHLRNREAVQERKLELVAKLEALQSNSQLDKATIVSNSPVVEIEAAV